MPICRRDQAGTWHSWPRWRYGVVALLALNLGGAPARGGDPAHHVHAVRGRDPQGANLPHAPAATDVAPTIAPVQIADDLHALATVAACLGPRTAATLPPALATPTGTALVEHHCRAITKRMEAYRKVYLAPRVRAFFAGLVPAEAPAVVVYPFGGGDLLSALVAFPRASEINTISLELAGDPSRVRQLSARALAKSLGALRQQIGGLLSVGSNTSENLSAQQRNDLPGQVTSFLLALATMGYQPLTLRYFTVADDGTLTYLDDAALAQAQAAAASATRRKSTWQSPNFAEAFAHVELTFRAGSDPAAPIVVHRHFGWNLSNDYLKAHPGVLAYLRQKGEVSWLVKGASYLLWRSDFATMRTFIVAHLGWMLSDSTGVPPAYLRAFEQTTYGRYAGAFLAGAEAGWQRHSDDFRALWQGQPHRSLPVRFGYVDRDKQVHVVTTVRSKPRAR